ncbi:hypothetical protein FKM82_017717 [Ascaphus truei]
MPVPFINPRGIHEVLLFCSCELPGEQLSGKQRGRLILGERYTEQDTGILYAMVSCAIPQCNSTCTPEELQITPNATQGVNTNQHSNQQADTVGERVMGNLIMRVVMCCNKTTDVSNNVAFLKWNGGERGREEEDGEKKKKDQEKLVKRMKEKE